MSVQTRVITAVLIATILVPSVKAQTDSIKTIGTDSIALGGFIIKPQSRKVLFNSDEAELTKKEFDLLLYLVLNRNKVLTRHQLYEHIWGNILDDQYDSNFIDVHVKNLRKKLNGFGPTPWFETVR